MPAKIPALFKKPLPEKKFRAYVVLIEQQADRALLESSFERTAEGAYALKSGLDAAALKKLALLAKAIKANAGAVKVVPLVLACLLAGGAAVFVILFMNPLLERAAEGALESAFEAKAEIESLRLDLGRLRLSIASVSVADRDRPMTNLFQMGRTELRLNPQALFRGKVYIEEARSDALAFGTPRSVSGALSGRSAVPRPPKPAAEAGPPLVDLANFDAMALLERERDKLAVTAAYAEAAAAYDAAVERWTGRTESVKGTAADLQAAARPVLAVQVRSLTTVAAVTAALKDVQTLTDSSKAAVREADGLVGGIQGDLDAARALERRARGAVGDDLARLKAYIDPSSGAALEALEPTIREILSDSAERYIEYGRRALELAEKLKSLQNDSAREKAGKTGAAFKGRNVLYPAAAHPLFRLGVLASDFTLDGYRWAFELKELSTEPDLVDAPSSLAVGVAGGGKDIRFSSLADFRSSSVDLFSAELSGSGLGVDLGDALKGAGIGSFTGSAGFTASVSGTKDRSLKGTAEIAVAEAALGSPAGTLAKALAEAAASVDAVRLDVAYGKERGGEESFKIRTNLGDIVAAAVRAAAERYAAQAAADLEKALRSYVASELEGKFASKGDLDALFAAAKGDKAAVDTLTKSLEAKRAELEGRAKAMAEEAAKKAAEEAAKKAAEAAGSLPKVDVPKVEPPKVRF